MKVPLLKGSDGKESVSFTMLIISFCVITLWLVVSIIEGIGNVTFRPFDAATAMAYFTPMAMLYFSRKTWTNAAQVVVSRGGIAENTASEPVETAETMPQHSVPPGV